MLSMPIIQALTELEMKVKGNFLPD
jgi:hypothetical protein